METQRPLTTVEEKQRWFEQYNNGIHRLGRSWTLVCLIALVGMPFLMGWALDTAPDMHVFWRGFLNVAIIYYPTSVVEYLIYVPMLGSGASYLSFITGNLSNLKIPCAINARDLANAKVGTPENEVLVPLQPILENPALTPAFDNVVPALFGALGLKYFLKGKKFAAIPLVVASLVCILMPSMIRQTSVLLIVIGGLTIAVAWLFYKKGALHK